MEFISEKKDYNVAEFYDQFSEALPKVVRVNQGYFGEIASDVFDKDQIIWLYAVSKQPRVIAKFQLPNHSMRLLSIPVTYEEHLCVVKHGMLGKTKPLRKILEKGHFPLTVQFPKDHNITVGSHSVSTSHIPKLELTETFDEMYFLGNYVNAGEMSDDVIDIPLYLSQLRFSLVTGIKDHTEDQWEAFVQNLACVSSTIVYDHTFGNPDIAEYDPSAIHSCDAYSYLEPTIYANIVSLVTRPHITPTTSYDVLEKENSSFAPIDEQAVPNCTVYKQIEETPASTSTLPPPCGNPKPQQHIPMPQIAPGDSTPSSQTHHHLTSPIVLPLDKIDTRTQPTYHGPPPPLKPKPIIHKQLPVVNNAEDVVKLSIDEVGGYLIQLKLDKYVDVFKTSMIDGTLLGDVSEEMLTKEFGFKQSEVLRFMAFARKGHFPK